MLIQNWTHIIHITLQIFLGGEIEHVLYVLSCFEHYAELLNSIYIYIWTYIKSRTTCYLCIVFLRRCSVFSGVVWIWGGVGELQHSMSTWLVHLVHNMQRFPRWGKNLVHQSQPVAQRKDLDMPFEDIEQLDIGWAWGAIDFLPMTLGWVLLEKLGGNWGHWLGFTMVSPNFRRFNIGAIKLLWWCYLLFDVIWCYMMLYDEHMQHHAFRLRLSMKDSIRYGSC